jgi:hypothetical protein
MSAVCVCVRSRTDNLRIGMYLRSVVSVGWGFLPGQTAWTSCARTIYPLHSTQPSVLLASGFGDGVLVIGLLYLSVGNRLRFASTLPHFVTRYQL